MKVDLNSQNYVASQRKLTSKHSNNGNMNQNFTGSIPTSTQKAILAWKPQATTLNFMKNLEWLKGELGGILITALGTGIVAPIFIGNNPFVKAPKDATPEQKQDVKNTKWYTAWRQPVSAVLAIMFQVSALKPIDIVLDKIFNNKEFSKKVGPLVDQSSINGEAYLKRTIAGEMKRENKTKPSLFKIFTNGWSKVMADRKLYDDELSRRITERQDEQVNKLAKVLEETGEIKFGADRTLDNKNLAGLVNEQIDSYIKDTETLKVDKRINKYLKCSDLMMNNEAKIKELFAKLPINEIKDTAFGPKLQEMYQNSPEVFEELFLLPEKALQSRVKGESEPAIKEMITEILDSRAKLKGLYKQTTDRLNEMLAEETSPEIKEIINNVLNEPEDLRARHAERILDRIKTIKTACGKKGYSREKYRDVLLSRDTELNRIRLKLEDVRIKDPAKATKESIQEVIKKVTEICSYKKTNKVLDTILHDTKTFDSDLQALASKIHKDIVKGYKDLVAHHYKTVNQSIKVLIGVCVTLPITCNVLNWVYPRFMEIFFPDLAGVKKGEDKEQIKNGGNK